MLLCAAIRERFRPPAKESDEQMKISIRVAFLGVLLFAMICSIMAGRPASATTAKESAIPEEKALAETNRRATAIPGEYLVLFRVRESVFHLQGPARSGAVAMMLEMQAEQLSAKYGVSVENTYSAISESSGKGMFFVRSEKAAKDPEFEKKLLEEMRADPMIEGVSPNEVQKMISAPQAMK